MLEMKKKYKILVVDDSRFNRAVMTSMLGKDYFLEELKQRRISSYKEAYVTSITVKVNPQTRPYVVMENNWY